MSPFFKKLFTEKRDVNYLYFSLFLTFLCVLSLLHYKELPVSGLSIFFLFYAVGQAFLEVCLLLLIVYLLKLWAPRWIHFLFISASFVFLLLHLTNFIMVRLMDASIHYIFKFFFGSGLEHLIAGFQALNLNWTMIGIIVATFAGIPLLGLGFYSFTLRLAQKKPLSLSLSQIAATIGMVAAALLFLDVLAHPFLNQRIYTKYQKTLPFGTTFLTPTSRTISLPYPITLYRDEKETQKKLPSLSSIHRPNIYFFVIETLRKDYLDAAPHLLRFGQEHIQFNHSFANANSTHLSWFSLFHADLPFYWTLMRDTWEKGSVPLQILKKLGYKIHVYSSADLRYFNMDKLIFGSDRQLTDSVEEYSCDRTLEPCDRDALAIESLKRDLQTQGHAYFIFLDSTHSEYSFPKDFPLEYQPISKEIDYLRMGPKSPELDLLKNRYRNAIHYIDHLMHGFFDTLKSRNLYDEAIIAITGDHGEEFFEEGALFHGTHLNHVQTNVPILLKVPSEDWHSQTEEATHIDLFPSILHYLTNQTLSSSLFDGRSIFSTERHPFRVAVLQNGPDIPVEFLLEKSDLKLRGRFADPWKLKVEILELQGSEPDPLSSLLQRF